MKPAHLITYGDLLTNTKLYVQELIDAGRTTLTQAECDALMHEPYGMITQHIIATHLLDVLDMIASRNRDARIGTQLPFMLSSAQRVSLKLTATKTIGYHNLEISRFKKSSVVVVTTQYNHHRLSAA